jgi:hypothetical protein
MKNELATFLNEMNQLESIKRLDCAHDSIGKQNSWRIS